MLKCRDISHQASDYQDKSLPLSGRLKFALHLLICVKCRNFIAHMLSASRVYQAMGEKQLEAVVADQLAAGIIAQATEKSSRPIGD